MVCPKPSGYLLEWAQASWVVNLASTSSERSLYPHTEILKDELVAGLALVDAWALSAEAKKAVVARWEALCMPRPPDHTGRVA